MLPLNHQNQSETNHENPTILRSPNHNRSVEDRHRHRYDRENAGVANAFHSEESSVMQYSAGFHIRLFSIIVFSMILIVVVGETV